MTVGHDWRVQDSSASMVHHLTALGYCRFRRHPMDYWDVLVNHWYVGVDRSMNHCSASVVHDLTALGQRRFS